VPGDAPSLDGQPDQATAWALGGHPLERGPADEIAGLAELDDAS
jgi:hypothetical protein